MKTFCLLLLYCYCFSVRCCQSVCVCPLCKFSHCGINKELLHCAKCQFCTDLVFCVYQKLIFVLNSCSWRLATLNVHPTSIVAIHAQFFQLQPKKKQTKKKTLKCIKSRRHENFLNSAPAVGPKKLHPSRSISHFHPWWHKTKMVKKCQHNH